jgi:drug/metabolite transporter (DMT)-like permease
MIPAICLGGFLAFVTAGLFGGGLSVAPSDVAVLAIMGPVQLAIPLVLFARSARYIQAATLSLIALLDAVLNPFWAWLGAGEIPTLYAVIGGAIILVAVAMSIIAGQRAAYASRAPAKLSTTAD